MLQVFLYFFIFFLLKSQVLEDVCFFWLSNKEACAITVLVLQTGINFLMDHRDVPFITILHDLQNTTTSSRTSSPFHAGSAVIKK